MRNMHPHSFARNSIASFLALTLGLFFTGSTRALEPDQILLLTNKNDRAGLRLAELYARKRGIPEHRILELDLPTDEEMPPDLYDREVVPAVRTFLRGNHLERKITCIVTFYGVPIRVSARVNARQDIEELESLKAEQLTLPAKIDPLVNALEKLVVQNDPTFAPKAGGTFEIEAQRADAAFRHLAEIARKTTGAERARLNESAQGVLESLIGQMGMLERNLLEQAMAARLQAATQPATPPGTQPATQPATQPTGSCDQVG